METTRLTDEQIRDLCVICTRDEAGKHFTEAGAVYADHWEDLERAGMIAVYRPVHGPTDVYYSQEHWSLKVTEDGRALVDAHPELHPAEPPTSLDDLLSLVLLGHPGVLDKHGQVRTDLPTFGGPDVEDTDNIWSWDETRVLSQVADERGWALLPR